MITRHYKRIVKDILQRGGAKYDAYAVTASDGRPYYTAQEQPNYSADQTAMSMSTDQPGVIIGSGTAAESEASYWLAQQITSGFSGSVLPTHEMVDGTHALCLYVTIANTGNSSITISEIGYALITPLMRRPSDSQFIGSPYPIEKNILIDRTVLASPITIAAGNSVRLKYALKTTDEIFSGSVVLIQKTINVNGVYNASSDNADGYSEVTVSVAPNLQSKTATQNGTVTPDQGYDGLSSVAVNVSGGGGIDAAGGFRVGSTSNAQMAINGQRLVSNMGHYSYRCLYLPKETMSAVDNTKDFEIGCAFMLKDFNSVFTLFAEVGNASNYAVYPSMEVNSNGSIGRGYTLASGADTVWTDFAYLEGVLVVDKWYFARMKFLSSQMKLISEITDDFVNYTQKQDTIADFVKIKTNQYGFGFGAFGNLTTRSSTAVIDLHNTYIKTDGNIIFGAYTEHFPT